jgi:hypothetical protein
METLLLAEMRRHDDPYRLWDQPDDGLTPPTRATTSATKTSATRTRKNRKKEK